MQLGTKLRAWCVQIIFNIKSNHVQIIIDIQFINPIEIFKHNFHKQFRFLVMPRFGSDLHKLWLNADKKFHRSTVNQVAVALVS